MPLTRFREDVEQIEETLSWTVDVIGSIFFSTVALWVLASIDAQLTLVVFAPLIVVVVLAERAGSMVERARRQARDATSEVTGAIGEIFGGVQAVKLAGAEDRAVGHLRRLNQARLKFMVRDRVLEEGLDALFWNTVNLGTGLVLLLAADRIGQPDGITVGDFALFVYFMGFITENVHVLGLFIARFRQGRVAIDLMSGMLGGAPPRRLAERSDLHLGEHRARGFAAPGPDARAAGAARDERPQLPAPRHRTRHHRGGPHHPGRLVHRDRRENRVGKDDPPQSDAGPGSARFGGDPMERGDGHRPGRVHGSPQGRLHAPGAAPFLHDAA